MNTLDTMQSFSPIQPWFASCTLSTQSIRPWHCFDRPSGDEQSRPDPLRDTRANSGPLQDLRHVYNLTSSSLLRLIASSPAILARPQSRSLIARKNYTLELVHHSYVSCPSLDICRSSPTSSSQTCPWPTNSPRPRFLVNRGT